MKKVLVSPGYGAGWSTWADDRIAQYVAEYQPIIEFIEGGGRFEHPVKDSPLVQQLHADLRKDFPDLDPQEPYLGGLAACVVVEVSGPYHITEYDGYETLDEPDSIQWFV